MIFILVKNEVGCRDDTVPKTVDTRKAPQAGLRACNNLPQPNPYILIFEGCGRLLHALNPPRSAFSFLMIFILVIVVTQRVAGESSKLFKRERIFKKCGSHD